MAAIGNNIAVGIPGLSDAVVSEGQMYLF